MKDSRNIIRPLALLLTIGSLTGCSLFTVKNEQNTDLGPRRRPAENPQGSMMAPQMPNQMQQGMDMNAPMPLMPQGMPQAPSGYGSSYAPQTGGSPAPGMMPQNSMPAPSSYPSVNPYGNAPGSMGGYPAMQQPMSTLQAPDMMDMGGEGADAAFARGGSMGVKQESKGWSLPFIGKYKEVAFEPLAAEYIVAENEAISTGESILKDTSREKNTNTQDDNFNVPAEKPSRKASMFPLEQYAPKPDTTVQKIEVKGSQYPKLGNVPENPSADPEKTAQELDNMVKEAEDADKKKAKIHNLPAPSAPSNPEKQQDATPQKEPEVKKDKPQSLNMEEKPSTPVVRQLDASAESLSNDAKVISQLPKEVGKQKPEKKEEKPGFFARIFGKSGSRQIVRKSEPPLIAERSEPAYEQALPAVNIPDDNIARPLPAAVINPGYDNYPKNYDSDNGTLLPNSRYTDRRKVSQTE